VRQASAICDSAISCCSLFIFSYLIMLTYVTISSAHRTSNYHFHRPPVLSPSDSTYFSFTVLLEQSNDQTSPPRSSDHEPCRNGHEHANRVDSCVGQRCALLESATLLRTRNSMLVCLHSLESNIPFKVLRIYKLSVNMHGSLEKISYR
jgi:hypothetical protein